MFRKTGQAGTFIKDLINAYSKESIRGATERQVRYQTQPIIECVLHKTDKNTVVFLEQQYVELTTCYNQKGDISNYY